MQYLGWLSYIYLTTLHIILNSFWYFLSDVIMFLKYKQKRAGYKSNIHNIYKNKKYPRNMVLKANIQPDPFL